MPAEEVKRGTKEGEVSATRKGRSEKASRNRVHLEESLFMKILVFWIRKKKKIAVKNSIRTIANMDMNY